MIVIWHEVSAMQSFIPRSGNDLQPNVAARRLRWVGSVKMTPQPSGVVSSLGSQSQGSRAARQPWAGLHNRVAVRKNLELDRIFLKFRRTFKGRSIPCHTGTSRPGG